MGQIGAVLSLRICASLCFPRQLLYESGVSLRTSFLFLSACSVIHLLRTFLLLPRKFIPYPLPDGYTYGCDLRTNSPWQISRVQRCRCSVDSVAVGFYQDHLWPISDSEVWEESRKKQHREQTGGDAIQHGRPPDTRCVCVCESLETCF